MEVWTYRDASLRGVDLGGFEVETLDGMLGRVERTATDSTGSYLVVDAGAQVPRGGRVLLPAGVVDNVDLDSERLFVRLTRREITGAPEYDWQRPLEPNRREEFASYYRARRSTEAPRTQARARERTLRSVEDGGRGRAETERREPTKQELYDEAKKLGIEGRSKMSKRELSRVLEREGGRRPSRTSTAKANPVEVQKFLEGVGYPTETSKLRREAERQGARREVRETLQRLPEKRFKTPTEVSEAIGKLK